jgi:hypothetical protein
MSFWNLVYKIVIINKKNNNLLVFVEQSKQMSNFKMWECSYRIPLKKMWSDMENILLGSNYSNRIAYYEFALFMYSNSSGTILKLI